MLLPFKLISFKVLFLSRVSGRALPVLSVKPMQKFMKRTCREVFFCGAEAIARIVWSVILGGGDNAHLLSHWLNARF